MKAMILAAGRGERMRPLTDFTPKPLLKVGGKPLIVWHIENLKKSGFSEIVINHAHLGAQIEDVLGNGQTWGVSIEYSPEQVALETAGGIANALHLLAGNPANNQPFLVVNGDVFTAFNFAPLQHVLSTNQSSHLVLIDNPPQHPNGDFALVDNMVESEGERKLTFSGIGVYRPSLFAHIEKGQPAKLAPILRAVMQLNQVSGEYFSGEWHDIGTPERLHNLDQDLLKANGLIKR